jgi:drug/metabolite transporter (DMT)-like permease
MTLTIGLTSPRQFRIDRKGLLGCIGAGIFLVGALQMFTTSLLYINVSIASMIVALYPLVVLILLALRGEKFTYRNTLRLALGLGGVYLLIGPGGQVDFLGIVLTLCTCLTFAIYLVMVQWFLSGYEARTTSLYVLITILVLNIGLWFWQGVAWPEANWVGWLPVIFLGLGSSYLGQMALYTAVREIGSGQMALLNPVETLLSVIWATTFLQEHLSLVQWAGSGLILVSMLLSIRRIGRSNRLAGWIRLRLRL